MVTPLSVLFRLTRSFGIINVRKISLTSMCLFTRKVVSISLTFSSHLAIREGPGRDKSFMLFLLFECINWLLFFQNNWITEWLHSAAETSIVRPRLSLEGFFIMNLISQFSTVFTYKRSKCEYFWEIRHLYLDKRKTWIGYSDQTYFY